MPATAKRKPAPAPKKPARSAARPAAPTRKPAAKAAKPATSAGKSAAAKAAPKPAKAKEKLTLAEVMAELEAAGSEQTRKIYLRHGAPPPLFGVSAATLKVLTKRIGVDQELAEKLWKTGNHDARWLAYKIADPKALTPADLDRWSEPEQISWAGMLLAALATEGPSGRKIVRGWLASKDPRRRTNGWYLVASLASNDPDESDAWFAERITQIEKTIHTATNGEKGPMNSALIAIGGRSVALRKAALAAAARIGVVTVDRGDTDCKTPDAAAYIEKTWAVADAKGFPSPAVQERERESMRTRC